MDENTTGERKQHILVVDDSEDMRELLGQLLEGAGYLVVFAEDGQASLTQAKLHHPDLILMDLSLPDMDGWEAIGYLRKMREFRTTPIIAVTAHVSTLEVERAMAAGCTAHIGKPFDTKVLLQNVARLLPAMVNMP
ncbi:MAG TPA: response regulator [Ktedonobacteraceae bacterium]|nr:response regulator [Ktedonobacteraceae bacterium]